VGVLRALALTINNFMNAGPAFPAGLIYIAFATLPLTLVHELGHALVARERLRTSVSITVGSAVKVAEVRLGEISASIHAVARPDRVAGSAMFDARDTTASDVAWIAIAGPIASLIGLIWATVLYSALPHAGILHDFVWALVLGSALGVIINLIPFEVQERRDQPPRRTDGKLLLSALRVVRQTR
jgi:hypothetical protein